MPSQPHGGHLGGLPSQPLGHRPHQELSVETVGPQPSPGCLLRPETGRCAGARLCARVPGSLERWQAEPASGEERGVRRPPAGARGPASRGAESEEALTASVRGRGQPGLPQDKRLLCPSGASSYSGGRQSRQELGTGRQGRQRGAGGRILTPEPGRPSTCPFPALMATPTLCIPSQAGPRPRAPRPSLMGCCRAQRSDQ